MIVNKCDLVDAAQIRRIRALIKSLNPDADVVTSVQSQLDLTRVLNTNRFSFEKSMLSAGWLKSLQEAIKPETEEYGIGYAMFIGKWTRRGGTLSGHRVRVRDASLLTACLSSCASAEALCTELDDPFTLVACGNWFGCDSW